MVDYKNGKIYKIVCNVTGRQYVGSTTQLLSQRKYGHNKGYKEWLKGNGGYVTSYKLIEGGDWDVVLLEEAPCDNKEQLHARERHYIDALDCVNKVKPCRTIEETKEYAKTYYQANAEVITKYKKNYYRANAGSAAMKHKEYRTANADKIKQRMKEYQTRNADKIKAWRSTRVICGCGSVPTKAQMH